LPGRATAGAVASCGSGCCTPVTTAPWLGGSGTPAAVALTATARRRFSAARRPCGSGTAAPRNEEQAERWEAMAAACSGARRSPRARRSAAECVSADARSCTRGELSGL
jgi:hypothetical protein